MKSSISILDISLKTKLPLQNHATMLFICTSFWGNYLG